MDRLVFIGVSTNEFGLSFNYYIQLFYSFKRVILLMSNTVYVVFTMKLCYCLQVNANLKYNLTND